MDENSLARHGKFTENSEKKPEGLLKQETMKMLRETITAASTGEHHLAKFKENNKLNFSHVWNGSLSSLMSCDNITESLVAESVKELEQALCESQNLLKERDNDITELRKQLQDCKISLNTDVERQEQLLKELKKSQQRVVDLENELSLQKSKEKVAKEAKPKIQSINVSDTAYTECTCYCGSVCNALREINDVKKRLEQTEHKYVTLKRKIREKRKIEVEAQRRSMNMTVNERAPGCVVQ